MNIVEFERPQIPARRGFPGSRVYDPLQPPANNCISAFRRPVCARSRRGSQTRGPGSDAPQGAAIGKPSGRLLQIFLVIGLALTTSTAASAAPASPGYESITSDDIMRHLRYLADDALEGRDTGEPGNEAAADYIAQRFRELGLRPVGDQGGFFQEFQVNLNPKAGAGAKFVSHVGGKESVHELKKDYALFDNATLSAASGQLVFAGYGISSGKHDYDDYAGLEVEGKVVLILRRAPRYGAKDAVFKGNPPVEATFLQKLKTAQKHGAAAILLADASDKRKPVAQESRNGVKPVGMGSRQGPPYAFIDFELADSWMKSHGEDLAKIVAAIDEDLKPRSRPLDKIRIELTSDIRREKVATRNVVGLLEGSDPELRNEIVVVGGHLDHVGYGPGGENRGNPKLIHNGADDNASGTSAVLELAESFALHSAWPKRSLLFINFNAEERGLLGSRHYADHPLLPLTNTVAMINLDMVGRGASGLDVGGVGTSPDFKSMVESMAKDFNFKFATTPGGRGASDHTSFYNKNIPVLFFFTGKHADYHKPSDEWQKINQPEIQSVTRMAWRVIEQLSNAPERPKFTKSDGNPVRRGRPRVQLGVQLNPNPGKAGVLIDAVLPDTPAAKADIRPGDLIQSINGRPMKNLRDVSLAVGRLKKGATANVQLQRREQRISVDVTF